MYPVEQDPISGKKFIKGVANPKTGLKALSFIPWLLLFALIGYCVYYTLKPKPTQTIIAKPGSNVQVTQVNRTSRFFIPFIELGVEQRSSNTMGTYIKVGCRIEF